MWHSGDQMFGDEEVVTDGAPLTRKDHHLGLSSESSKYTSKINTDSGFLSGVSINEDSSYAISGSLDDHQATTNKQPTVAMKLDSSLVGHYSDSGLDLKYSSDPKINNLNNSPTAKPSNIQAAPAPRRITLHDLLRQDEDGDTLLHLAVLQGFIEVVFSLVRILSDPCLLEIPNKKLQSPLHLAVLTNQAPLVRRLVVGGASVLQRDRYGNTPLHLACRDGSLDCARALLMPVREEERRSALLPPQTIPQPLPQDLELRNYEGQMPLHLAAMNGHVHVIRLLHCFGANMNATEAKYGRTALHYAVERRQPALLHHLVREWGALTESETYSGYTAYQLAAAACPMLAMLLADLGAQQRPWPMDLSSSSSEGDDSDLSSDGELSKPWRSLNDQNLAMMMNEALHLAA